MRYLQDCQSPQLAVLAQDAALAALACMTVSRHRSYDYVDWWATPWGRVAKELAYRTEPLGNLVFAAPILLLEWFLPGVRPAVGIGKSVYPISVAHHGLTCLELFESTRDDVYLEAAAEDVETLLRLTAPCDHGLAWGLPFSWPSSAGLLPANVPMVTQSAYGFDLLDGLWRQTGESRYLHLLHDVAMAMADGYGDLPRERGVANTYGMGGFGAVAVNAISYRMHVLARAAVAVGRPEWRSKAHQLADYVVSRQQQDGSWFYGESPKNEFIDHFHTCFVLKNLARAGQALERPDFQGTISLGVKYYWENLFDTHGLPRPFARTARFNPVRYESYDFAECLGLFSLLGPDLGFTTERRDHVLAGFLRYLATDSGAIRFRIYRFPTPVGLPYFRYGMSALTLALAALARTMIQGQEPS